MRKNVLETPLLNNVPVYPGGILPPPEGSTLSIHEDEDGRKYIVCQTDLDPHQSEDDIRKARDRIALIWRQIISGDFLVDFSETKTDEGILELVRNYGFLRDDVIEKWATPLSRPHKIQSVDGVDYFEQHIKPPLQGVFLNNVWRAEPLQTWKDFLEEVKTHVSDLEALKKKASGKKMADAKRSIAGRVSLRHQRPVYLRLQTLKKGSLSFSPVIQIPCLEAAVWFYFALQLEGKRTCPRCGRNMDFYSPRQRLCEDCKRAAVAERAMWSYAGKIWRKLSEAQRVEILQEEGYPVDILDWNAFDGKTDKKDALRAAMVEKGYIKTSRTFE